MQLQNSSYKDEVLSHNDNPSDISAEAAVQNWLVTKLAEQLSLNAKTIDVREPLTRYGLDSIDAVTMVGDLEDWLGLDLPDTLLWDYPSIEKAAQYMVTEFDVAAALTNAAPVTQVEEKPEEKEEKASAGKGWGGLWGRISGS
jgi:acyl carrier protein